MLTLGDRVSHADPARAAAVARAQLLAMLGRDTQRRASRLRAARGGWAQALLSRLLARLSLQVFAPPPPLPSPPPLAATSAQSRRARQNARRHAAQVARVSVSVSSPGARPGHPFAFELALAALTLGVDAPEAGSFETPRRVEVCAPSPRAPGAQREGQSTDAARAPRSPSRTNWTRLVPPPVLTGHVSSAHPAPPVRRPRADAPGRGRAPAGAVTLRIAVPCRAGRRAASAGHGAWAIRLRPSRAAGCRLRPFRCGAARGARLVRGAGARRGRSARRGCGWPARRAWRGRSSRGCCRRPAPRCATRPSGLRVRPPRPAAADTCRCTPRHSPLRQAPSTRGGWTRRVRSVREEGRDVSS